MRTYWLALLLGAVVLALMALAVTHVSRLNRRLRQSEHALREAHDGLNVRVEERTRELRAAVEALGSSEQRYHDLYESAPNGYASVRASDGSILQANAAFARLLGYRPDELRALKVHELYADTPDGKPVAKRVFERFVGGESVRDTPVEMRRKDGSSTWVSLSIEPVFDAEGHVVESRSSILDISARKRAEAEQAKMAARLERSLLQTIQAIALTIEKRDPYTAGHQQRVSELAVMIGERLGLDRERLRGLRLGALIHDIGKIYVPVEILNRPGRLDAAQRQIIRSHPRVGFDIVKEIEFPWPLAAIVAQHHERIDGTGYPDGLRGDDILLEARILAVADVVEALASHRPYRAAWPITEALGEIESHRGTWFDPRVVDVCLRVFRDERFSWSRSAA